jgi:cytochrome c
MANLKDIPPAERVMSVGHCLGKYDVGLRNGSTRTFKEYDLAFEIDSGPNGPRPGTPALVSTGGVGNRAFAIFADLDELRRSLKAWCRD